MHKNPFQSYSVFRGNSMMMMMMTTIFGCHINYNTSTRSPYLSFHSVSLEKKNSLNYVYHLTLPYLIE